LLLKKNPGVEVRVNEKAHIVKNWYEGNIQSLSPYEIITLNTGMQKMMNCTINNHRAKFALKSVGSRNQKSDVMITTTPNTNEISNRDIGHFLKYFLILLNARKIPATIIKAAEEIIIPLINSKEYIKMYYSLTS